MTPLAHLKATVKNAVATRAGWRFARRARRPGCVVLLYHRVGLPTDPFPNLDAANFAAQIAWLARNCRVIDPDELRDAAFEKTPGDRPNVLITFDDGYRDYFEHAYPVLRTYGFRAINFLSTAYVDDPSRVGWWDRLFLAVGRTRRARVELPWLESPMALDRHGRGEFLRAAKAHIKAQPQDDIEPTVATILEALDVDDLSAAVSRQTMTWDEVREAADFTRYGGHTHSHVIVAQVSPASLEAEIRCCRDRLAAEIGAAPDAFAYPNGCAADFNDAAKDMLRQYGFRTAFSAIPGLNDATTDWMEVRRIAGGRSVADLAWRLSRAAA